MKELLKKKTTKIGIAVIILSVAIGIISINARSAQRQREYDGHVEAAEKYLTELDYEQAIAEYTLALEIEPNAEEVLNALGQTYLDYAKSVADGGDYERAVDILDEGYAMTERESLKEQMEEYAAQQKIKKQEEAEAAQSEEIKQLVESDEFHDQVWALASVVYWQIITDEQVRELCQSKIEVLERYRELYPENGGHYRELQELYFLVGEYELCVQIRGELHELYPDNRDFWSYYKGEDGEYIKDEYGRYIKSTTFYYDGNDYKGKNVEEIEYGQNGKVIRVTVINDAGKSAGETVIDTATWDYEYDSEGRLSKITAVADGWGYRISVMTLEYSEGGFTTYENGETNYNDFHEVYRITRDYVINEYGKFEMVGEPIYEQIQ